MNRDGLEVWVGVALILVFLGAILGIILFATPNRGEGVVTSISENECGLLACFNTVYFGDSNSLQCSAQSTSQLTLGEKVSYYQPYLVDKNCVFTPL